MRRADLEPQAFTWWLWIAFLLLMLVGVVAGAARGFSRWCYAYLGPFWLLPGGVVVALLMSSMPHSQAVPLVLPATMEVGLLLVATVRPLRALRQSLIGDWTQLSFAVYLLALPTILLTVDEVPEETSIPS